MLHSFSILSRIRFIRESLIAVIFLVSCLITGGCTQSPYLGSPNGAAWQGQGPVMGPSQPQLAEMTRRIQLLDDNNRQLTTELAQSVQQSQVYQDELQIVRNQLADVTHQFDVAKVAANKAENRVRNFQASTQIRGGASISPNTNLKALAGRLNLPGVPIQQDGELIRIVLSSDQMFRTGTPQLLPSATNVLDPVAGQIRTVFPRHRIAIEGYTDNSPHYGGHASSSHELASAQTSAVLGLLTKRSGLPSQQLFTVAQGANNPIQSNGTPAGRAANRRIELVIYPETF